jgi:hypothetical protein
MFEGNVPLDELSQHTPATHGPIPPEIETADQETSVGISYRFAALWGEDQPKSDVSTVVARYTGPRPADLFGAKFCSNVCEIRRLREFISPAAGLDGERDGASVDR